MTCLQGRHRAGPVNTPESLAIASEPSLRPEPQIPHDAVPRPYSAGTTAARVPAAVRDATGTSLVQGSLADAHLGHSRHVLDRFHVIRWFSAGLTQVRRDIQRREPHGIKPAFDPEVFRARFALLRRGDTLTDADRARLDKLFDAHPRLRAGWQALQELHGLYLPPRCRPDRCWPVRVRTRSPLGGVVAAGPGAPARPTRRSSAAVFCGHDSCAGPGRLGLADRLPPRCRPDRCWPVRVRTRSPLGGVVAAGPGAPARRGRVVSHGRHPVGGTARSTGRLTAPCRLPSTPLTADRKARIGEEYRPSCRMSTSRMSTSKLSISSGWRLTLNRRYCMSLTWRSTSE